MRDVHFHTTIGIMTQGQPQEDPRVVAGSVRLGEPDHTPEVEEVLTVKSRTACSVKSHIPANLFLEWPKLAL